MLSLLAMHLLNGRTAAKDTGMVKVILLRQEREAYPRSAVDPRGDAVLFMAKVILFPSCSLGPRLFLFMVSLTSGDNETGTSEENIRPVHRVASKERKTAKSNAKSEQHTRAIVFFLSANFTTGMKIFSTA
jgi:hypothetical protein